MSPTIENGSLELTLVLPDGTSYPFEMRVGPTPPADRPPAMFVSNVLLIALAGVCTCIWLLAFTEYIGVVATALGLGGALVWVAFIGNLLRDERKKQIQQWFEERVLTNRYTRIGILILLVPLGLLAITHGAVIVENRDDGAARVVSVRDAESDREVAEAIVPANSSVKVLVPWGTYLLRSYGLPPAEVTVKPLWRSAIMVPIAFRRQVVAAVRLHEQFAVGQRYSEMRVSIMRAGWSRPREAKVVKYDGHSVWVGCDDSVRVPDDVVSRWISDYRRRLGDQNATPPLEWTRMSSLLPNLVLHQDDHFKVELFNERGRLVASREGTLTAAGYNEQLQEIFVE